MSMSRAGLTLSNLTGRPTRPVLAAADGHEIRRGLPLPLYGTLIFAGLRVLSLAVAWVLLPRGRFHLVHASLRGLLKSWDGGRYLYIAAHGYPGDRNILWFPGYPAAIRAVHAIPGVHLGEAALIVTIIAGLAAAWGLTRLVMTLTGNRRISLLTTALWAVAPASFVLSMMYSEALFCALAVWALVALAERRWLTAAGLTILAGTVHTSAVALIAAVIFAAVPVLFRAAEERQRFAAWWRPAAALVLAPLGLLGFFAYAALTTHRLNGWFLDEEKVHNGFDLGRSLLLTLKHAIAWGPSAYVALTLLVIAAAVVLAGFSLTERLPASVQAYTLAIVLLALASGPGYLGSKPRFLLPAMLLGLPLARWLAQARTWLLIPLITMFAVASTWFFLYLITFHWAP
jgi:Gpi18-like mannosyltransferase